MNGLTIPGAGAPGYALPPLRGYVWLSGLVMPSTFTSLAYHVVFGTKHRRQFLHASWRGRLYSYIGDIVRAEGGVLTGIGRVEDHVHLLVQLKPTHTLADVVQVIKSNTSKWINDEGLVEDRFAWREGYSAFTVSQSPIKAVRDYLLRQEQRHREASCRDELQLLCERHGAEFDAEHFDQTRQ